VGDITSRFVSLERIREQLTTTAVESIIDGLLVIVMLGVLCLYSLKLTLIVVGATALYFLLRLACHAALREASEEQISATAKRDSSLIETIRSMQGIKISQREAQRLSIWQNHFADSLNAGIRSGKISAALACANQLIFGLEKIAVIYLAAKLIMDSQMTIGGLLAYLAYKTQFTEKAAGLVDKWQQLRLTRIHLDRVADIVLTPAEAPQLVPHMPVEHSGRPGSLRLANVHFRYGSNDPFVLRGVNLDVAPGESVAIVGGSGQGKTTLLKVLLGLLQPSEGQVLVDGHDIWTQGNAVLRQRIAAVMQDELPLSGTVAENIAFFDEAVDMDRVLHAAMSAGLHHDIMRMPMQYQSLIGDMGSSLSGGQRQRLLVARALYRQPNVIVMDEATSNLDVMTERMLSTSIKRLDITRILVAHRPETIRSADRILVLEGGELKEMAKEELLRMLDQVAPPRFEQAPMVA
jgi:ATP-binding cassette subfamily B protein RaxB